MCSGDDELPTAGRGTHNTQLERVGNFNIIIVLMTVIMITMSSFPVHTQQVQSSTPLNPLSVVITHVYFTVWPSKFGHMLSNHRAII